LALIVSRTYHLPSLTSHTNKLRTAYEATEGLVRDEAQQRIVDKLVDLQRALAADGRGRRSLLQRLGIRGPGPAIRGLYLWGDVGGGKTFLMDLFYQTLTIPDKKRIHFHRMMSELHARLNAAKGEEDPLDGIAEAMAREIRVLCFDEFFVSDIGDAMILGRFLDGLFRHGVTLVATSNSPPGDLYQGGLQRERFLPAIRLLEQHTTVVELDTGTDYRLRLLQQEGTFFTGASEATEQRLLHCLEQIAPGNIEKEKIIRILGRPIRTKYAAKGIAWFDFMELCDGPRSQQDYIEIARSYQTVMISGIPVLNNELDDPARRFIALVDEFYDRHVKLILASAVSVELLYEGTRLAFEFERTRSRLAEMQSKRYLHLAHLS
jgi:cell division protein ZapE